jgi:DNA polymerase V
MKNHWIGVLDCNNFFVSCERLFRPDLLGKPVVVLSSNDGCVVARSQEIKDMGIAMGVPYFQIKDILNKACATTFSSNFPLYRDISRRVIQVMRSELETVEQYSVDEAFFVTDSNPELISRQLKLAVEKLVGIPVSVGIARTKTQAKFASTLAKKSDGICVLDESGWTGLIGTVLLSKIWGVGGQLEMKYKQNGLLTVADLLAVDRSRVARIFGSGGVQLQSELNGQSVLLVKKRMALQQSVTSSRSFAKTTTEKAVLADAVAYHVRQVAADLRAQGLETKSIRVSIQPSRHGDFVLRGGSKEAVLPVTTANTIYLLQVANELLESIYEPSVPYKKAGVILTGLTAVGLGQQQLFETGTETKSDSLMAVIDKLNSRKGKELVTLGSRLRTEEWRSRTDVPSPAYTTRWTDVVSVQAK